MRNASKLKSSRLAEYKQAELKRQQDEKERQDAKQAAQEELLRKQKEAEIERVAKLRKTNDLINDFFADFQEMLDELNNEPSTDQQIDTCYALSKKLDDELKTQTWELHCQIQTIELLPADAPGSQRLYNVAHQLPDEITAIPDGWDILAKASSLPLLRLAKQQVFKGDYIVYVGTPRFITKAVDEDEEDELDADSPAKKIQPLGARLTDAKCFNCTIEIAGVRYTQTLYLTDLRFQFLKPENEMANRANMQIAKSTSLPISNPAILSTLATSPQQEVPQQVNVYQRNTYVNPYPLYSSVWWVWQHEHHHGSAHRDHRQSVASKQTPSVAPPVKVVPRTNPVKIPQRTRVSAISPAPVRAPVKIPPPVKKPRR